VAQQVAREAGFPLQVVRQHGHDDGIRDSDQIRPIVIAWRDSFSASLAEHLTSPLVWDEQPDSLYFTDKPTWDCYGDLMLWAAYDEQRQLRLPSEHVEDWSSDSAYLTATQRGDSGRS
jgi:hypothetical protein